MSDFEKKVGIIEVDVDYTQAQKAVADFTDSIIDQKNTIASNNAEIKSLNKANAELEKQVKKGNLSFDEANKEIEENAKRVNNLKKENAFLGDEIKDLNKERANAVKATKLQSNSLDALKNKVKEQKKELSLLSTKTDEGREAFEKLEKEIRQNVSQVNELEKGTGGLRDAVRDASKENQTFAGASEQLNQSIGGSIDGLAGMKKAALAFIATPLGAVIGLIAGAFLLVQNALSRNEQLTHKLNKAVAPLTSGFQVLLGALEPVAEFLIDGLVAGLEAASKAFSWFTDLLGDGLEKLGFDEAAKSVRDFAEEVEKAGDLSVKILDLEKAQRKLNRELSKTNATLQGQIDLLQQQADDATLSFEKQQQGAEAVRKKREELFKKNMAQAKAEEEVINSRIALARLEGKSVEDLLDQQADAVAARIEVENEYNTFVAENAMLRRQLAQDVWEQDLDFAIDVGTRRTEEAQRAAENENLSLEDRKKSLEEARALDQEAFENQMRLFEQVGLSREKINELVNESNAQVIASELKKTELSEIERNRFRELVLERQGLVEGLAATETSINEAVAKSSEDRLAKQAELNTKLLELEDFRREQMNERRLMEAESEQAFLDTKRQIAEEDFQLKMERILAEEEALAEQKFETEEEKAIAQAEIDLAKEEAFAEHEGRLLEIQTESDNAKIEQTKRTFGTIRAITQAAQNTLNAITDAASTKVENRYRKRFANLEKQLKSGQITEEEYAAKKERLEQKQALAQWRVEKAAFQVQKAIDLANVGTAIAASIAKAVKATPTTGGMPFAAINAAIGAVQFATISSKKPPPRPTFELGGDVQSFLIGGKPHSQGGTKFWGEDGTTFEAQKDEGLFITKREATNPALQLLDQANTAFGGRSMFASSSRFMQEGGSVENAPAGISPEALTEAIESMPAPVVDIESVMAGIEATQDAKRIGIA